MVDVDGFGNDAGRELRDSTEKVDVPEIGQVAATRRRRTGLAAAAGAFVLTLVVLGGASLFGPDPEPATDVATPSPTDPPPSTNAEPLTAAPANAVDGVTITWPDGWQASAVGLTGFVDPVELFSVATFFLDPALGSCGPFPWQAVVDFPADGGFVTVRERFRDGDFGPRPAQLGLPDGPRYVLPEGDCVDNTSRGDLGSIHLYAFEEQGRFIELAVVLGSEASSETQAEAWAIANSIVIEPGDGVAVLTSEAIYGGNAFILDDGDGPEACGAVAESLPPQCGGPRVVGLEWENVPWADSAQGVTWADAYIEFRVVEGEFHLTATPSERRDLEVPDVQIRRPQAAVEVAAIRDELAAFRPNDWPAGLIGVHGFSANLEDGYVEIWALLVTDEGRQWLDERYGDGAVLATSSFFPVDEIGYAPTTPTERTAPSLPGEPDTVHARDPLYYCGTTIGFAIDEATTADAAAEMGLTVDPGAQSCFEERSTADEGAELIVVNVTIEGDLIISIRRHLPDGTAEIFDDTTRDAFGQRAWVRYTCAEHDPASLEVGSCSEPEVVG